MDRPLRILIAEDDQGDALLIERALKFSENGASVHFVRDGREAIDYLRRRPPFGDQVGIPAPTLLLLDLNLPKVSGFDVLRWVRKQPSLRRLNVVVFTSSENPQDQRKALALGADAYVVKPVTIDDFIESVLDMEKYWLRLNATPECEFVH